MKWQEAKFSYLKNASSKFSDKNNVILRHNMTGVNSNFPGGAIYLISSLCFSVVIETRNIYFFRNTAVYFPCRR